MKTTSLAKLALALGLVLVASGCLGTPGTVHANDHGPSGPGPALALGTQEIGRSPTDVPAPIHRTTTKHLWFDITAQELVGQVQDGDTYTYWTFGGQVPGPMLRGMVGDTVTINFTNAEGNTMWHDIDLHAVTGPGGGAPALLAGPGQTKSITFKLLHPGFFLYHCASGNVANHIAHGMYGGFLVEPVGGLPPVDHEYYVGQSEMYSTYPADMPGQHEMNLTNLQAEHPTWVVFNGRVGSLTGDRALQSSVNDTVRIYFVDGGPNYVSSFHIIGEHLDLVYDQGGLLNPPLQELQTTLVPSGGATVVTLTTEYPGDYKLVDHSIARVNQGAVGILHVTGPANDTIFHAGD